MSYLSEQSNKSWTSIVNEVGVDQSAVKYSLNENSNINNCGEVLHNKDVIDLGIYGVTKKQKQSKNKRVRLDTYETSLSSKIDTVKPKFDGLINGLDNVSSDMTNNIFSDIQSKVSSDIPNDTNMSSNIPNDTNMSSDIPNDTNMSSDIPNDTNMSSDIPDSTNVFSDVGNDTLVDVIVSGECNSVSDNINVHTDSKNVKHTADIKDTKNTKNIKNSKEIESNKKQVQNEIVAHNKANKIRVASLEALLIENPKDAVMLSQLEYIKNFTKEMSLLTIKDSYKAGSNNVSVENSNVVVNNNDEIKNSNNVVNRNAVVNKNAVVNRNNNNVFNKNNNNVVNKNNNIVVNKSNNIVESNSSNVVVNKNINSLGNKGVNSAWNNSIINNKVDSNVTKSSINGIIQQDISNKSETVDFKLVKFKRQVPSDNVIKPSKDIAEYEKRQKELVKFAVQFIGELLGDGKALIGAKNNNTDTEDSFFDISVNCYRKYLGVIENLRVLPAKFLDPTFVINTTYHTTSHQIFKRYLYEALKTIVGENHNIHIKFIKPMENLVYLIQFYHRREKEDYIKYRC